MMKMSDVWPKSKAITLVFCRKMTKVYIDLGVFLNEKYVKLDAGK